MNSSIEIGVELLQMPRVWLVPREVICNSRENLLKDLPQLTVIPPFSSTCLPLSSATQKLHLYYRSCAPHLPHWLVRLGLVTLS